MAMIHNVIQMRTTPTIHDITGSLYSRYLKYSSNYMYPDSMYHAPHLLLKLIRIACVGQYKYERSLKKTSHELYFIVIIRSGKN